MTARNDEIRKGLSNINRLRSIFLLILFSLFPLLVLIMKAGVPDYPAVLLLLPWFGLFMFGIFIQHRLHRSRCPRCHDFFFVQSSEQNTHLPPMSSLSFPPQKQCQNCGLNLY